MTQMVERHFYRMALDLTGGPLDAPTLPSGFALEPLSSEWVAAYGDVVARAYTSDHVDHRPEDADPFLAAQAIEAALRGDELGPWLPAASAHIRHQRGNIVAAIVISERVAGEPEPDNPDPGGPWINDVFVDPAVAGRRLGAALVINAANCLTATTRSHLRLAVTHGNPAIHLYERLGFRVEQEVRRLRPVDGLDGRSS
jgi:ribosomal protein S18 acetylase RimI-like enzyme